MERKGEAAEVGWLGQDVGDNVCVRARVASKRCYLTLQLFPGAYVAGVECYSPPRTTTALVPAFIPLNLLSPSPSKRVIFSGTPFTAIFDVRLAQSRRIFSLIPCCM